jgi:hypothetical protein
LFIHPRSLKNLLKFIVYSLLLLEVVDFRSRMLAFRGVCGEPPWRSAPLGVSPVPLIPLESRTLHSNQLVNEEKRNKTKETSF